MTATIERPASRRADVRPFDADAALIAAVRVVVRAATRELYRYRMDVVAFRADPAEPGNVVVWASDGRRLARWTTPRPAGFPDGMAEIADVRAALRGKGSVSRLAARIVPEEEFPPVEDIADAPRPRWTAAVARDDIRPALRLANVCTDAKAPCVVVSAVSTLDGCHGVHLQTRTPDASSEQVVALDGASGTLGASVAVNPKFLLDALAGARRAQIVHIAAEGSGPVVVTAEGAPWTWWISPIRLD